MWFQGEFETFKMIEQDGKVTCCTDYTDGCLLIRLIQRNEIIDKNQLWKWLNEICYQLDAYHRCYHRAYQYVNPYTILVSKEKTIKLLDLDTQENEKVLIYLQRSIIRESFSKGGNIKRTRICADYYSLGRTLQFIVAQGNIIPSINVMESYSLSKIINKCLEETSEIAFQNIKEIQKQLPKIKSSNNRINF